MTLTITLADLLTAACTLAILGVPALYWSVRMAISAEVGRLERRILENYRTKASCKEIRDECERHRHEVAAATAAAAVAQPSRPRH